ncbi:MAG: hypothetical protein JXA60_02180 [Candidatus Coatesbacteria bacterium]|nr:hypothetical protein [Candidatus Coatesbacteria bacterium]
MKTFLVLLTILVLACSVFALDIDFFGKVEGRLRYETDNQTNNTDSDPNTAKDESKYNDLSFLYGGFMGTEAKFRNSLKAVAILALDSGSNLTKAPDKDDDSKSTPLTLDEAAVYYKTDQLFFAMGKYNEKDHVGKTLHYNPQKPIDSWWSDEHRPYMIGISPGFFVSKNIMFKLSTDVITNTHGSTTKTKGGSESENPSKDQWMISGSIPMTLMEKGALTFEPIFLYSLEGISEYEDTLGVSYNRNAPRLTFGAALSWKMTEMITFNLGGGMTSSNIDKEADNDKSINAAFHKDSGMALHAGFSFKNIGFGTINLIGHYGTNKETKKSGNAEEDQTLNSMFFKVEYPIILGRLDTENEKKREKTQIYLNPRLRVWMFTWDPDDAKELDKETKIRPELIIGARF